MLAPAMGGSAMTKFKDFWVGEFATENDDNDSAADKEVAFSHGVGAVR